MVQVLVEVKEDYPRAREGLANFLTEKGVGHAVQGSSYVEIKTFEDCKNIGLRIAEFIASSPGKYELFFDGPSAESELYQLHTPRDAEVISGTLATCAGLQ